MRDYVEAMWLILQHHEPDDFVVATGENHSVREFVERAFKEVGIHVTWQGEGIDERGIDAETGRLWLQWTPRYFRPTEVHELLGDAAKARDILGWKPRVSFAELVRRMVVADLRRRKKNNCVGPPATIDERWTKTPRIYVAGHTGMVGSALCRRLAKDSNILVQPPTRVDLRDQQATRDLFNDLKT